MTDRTIHANDYLALLFRRTEAAKLVGGISLNEVRHGEISVPYGYTLDTFTGYFVPNVAALDCSMSVH